MVRARRAAAWALVDQVLSSGSNLLLPLIGISRLDARSAGRLSLALSIVFISIGIARGVVGEAFVVYASREPERTKSDLREKMLGLSVVLGLFLGACLGLFLGLYLKAGVAAVFVGLLFSAVIMQDASRYVFFEKGRAEGAALNDALWLVTFAVPVFALRTGSPLGLLMLWCASGAFSALVALVQLRVRPRPIGAVALMRAHARTSWRIAAEFVVTSGVPQVLVAMVALWGALEGSASYRLATTLLTPVGVVATGLSAGLQPIVMRAHQKRDMRRVVMASWAVSTAVLVLCVTVVQLLPRNLAVRVLGESFPAARPLVALLGLASIALNGCAAVGMELRARLLLSRALAIRTATGVATIAVAVFVVPRSAAAGAATVFMLGAWVTLAGFLSAARRPFNSGVS